MSSCDPVMTQRWISTELGIERRGGNSRVIQVKDASGAFPGFAAQKILLNERFAKYARFIREVRVASTLQHPNITPVLDSYLPDVPTASQPAFMVMPWLGGGSLATRVEEGTHKNQPTAALKVLLPILDAVRYLHMRGKFHRDIKPSNIVLDERGVPFLTDFGLCFELDDDERLTPAEEKVGSLGYRAPEYVGGRHELLDHAPGDIFSLGKTLWALLAGEQATEGACLQYPKYNLIGRSSNPGLGPVQQLIQWMTRENPVERPKIEDVIAEVNLLLAPPKDLGRDVVGAELGRRFRTFLETDPGLAESRHSEEENARAATQVRILLEDLKRQIQQERELLDFQAEHADAFMGRMVSVGGPEPFCPADFIVRGLAATTPDIDISALSKGQAVYVTYRPRDDLADRMPMVMATWTAIRKRRAVTIVSYVYAAQRGGERPWRGTVPIREAVHFRSHLDAPSLRAGLSGLVPRQVNVFLEMLAEYLAQARNEVVLPAEVNADKVIKQTFSAEAEQVVVKLGLYAGLVAAIDRASSDPQAACCQLAGLGYDLLQHVAAAARQFPEGSEARGIAVLDTRLLESKVEELCQAMGIRIRVAISGAREVIIARQQFDLAMFRDGLGRLAGVVRHAAGLFR